MSLCVFHWHNWPLCCKSLQTINAQMGMCVYCIHSLKAQAWTLLSNHLIHGTNRLFSHEHPEGLLGGLHIAVCLLLWFCSCVSLISKWNTSSYGTAYSNYVCMQIRSMASVISFHQLVFQLWFLLFVELEISTSVIIISKLTQKIKPILIHMKSH